MARPLKKVQGLYEKVSGSGIWYIRYRLDGKLVRKMIGEREVAMDALKKINTIRTSGIGIVATSAKGLTLTADEQSTVEAGKTTVGQLCEQYLSFIQNPANPEPLRDLVNPPHRIAAIKQAFGHRAADLVKPFEIKEWLSGLDMTNGTRNRYRSTFSAVYRHAKERDRVQNNPVRDFPQFRVVQGEPRWLRPEEEKRLRDVLQGWIDWCNASIKM